MSGLPWVASTAVLVAVAVALAVPVLPSTGPWRRPARWPARRLVPLGATTLVLAGLVVGGGHAALLVGVAAGVAVGVLRLRELRRGAVDAARASAGVAQFCEAVAAELVAGVPARRALAAGAAEVPELAPVAAAAELDADVAEAMRSLARQPGRHDLAVVAAAWQVSVRCGGGFAEPLERAAATLRERRRTARVVRAELAPARATAQLMAVLPVVFLVAGSGLGGHPLGFLTGTTPGSVCLVLGLLLSGAGLAWLEVIAGSVERVP